MTSRHTPQLFIRLLVLVVLAPALMACNGGDSDPAPAGDESPEAASPAEMEADAALTTEATSEAESGDADSDGAALPDAGLEVDPEAIAVTVDPIADGVDRTVVPRAGDDGAPPWAQVPEHVQLSLEGYTLADTFHEPVIRMYPVAAFSAMNEPAALVIEQLRSLVEAQPAELPDQLPFLPPFNAAQMFYAQSEFIEGDGSQGLRFVTQYSQARVPLNNHELFYTYQGLTPDGRHYVSAILPVSSPVLPDEAEMPEDAQAFDAEFEAYIASTAAELNALDAGDFEPSLDALDAVVRSLSVPRE